MHSAPSTDELLFFDASPELLPLYLDFRALLLERFPEVIVKVSKTQISFRNRAIFCMASLRRIKGFPVPHLLISFGLGHRQESPRIPAAVEPYPNRWTHHMPIACAEDMDGEFWRWIDEAHCFSIMK